MKSGDLLLTFLKQVKKMNFVSKIMPYFGSWIYFLFLFFCFLFPLKPRGWARLRRGKAPGKGARGFMTQSQRRASPRPRSAHSPPGPPEAEKPRVVGWDSANHTQDLEKPPPALECTKPMNGKTGFGEYDGPDDKRRTHRWVSVHIPRRVFSGVFWPRKRPPAPRLERKKT